MKSSKVKLEQIADPDNLREAFLAAAKGKGEREAVQRFRSKLDDELLRLRDDILGNSLDLGHFSSFTVFEPKKRRIHAPAFRERVLHHALMRQFEPDLERWSIEDSFACRKGKGRERAVARAEGFARRSKWFLKLDIAKYFDTIPHGRLLGEITRRTSDRRVNVLWHAIIATYEKEAGRGLPIGSLTSQHLANFYLGAVDREVKQRLRIKGYLRYMDDMLLFGTRDEMLAGKAHLERYIPEVLGLELNPAVSLQPVERGVPFLGYRIRGNGTRLLRCSRRRFFRRWTALLRRMEKGDISELEAQVSTLSMISFMRIARRDNILEFLFG